MRKQNFKSDFDFILSLLDGEGNDVGFPDFNWRLTLYTQSKDLSYEVSRQYGENVNCRNEEGKIHAYVDRHEFPVGELLYELEVEIPDAGFPDGSRRVVVRDTTDIEIVNEKGQTLTEVVVSVTVPHLKKPKEESPTPPAQEGDSQKENNTPA